MSFETFFLIGQINVALSALIVILCSYHYRAREKYVKLIGLLFLTSFISDVTSLMIGKYGSREFINIPPSLYPILSILIISYTYYFSLKSRYGWMLYTAYAAVIFFSFNFILTQKDTITALNNFITCGLVIVYSVTYFYKLMEELPSIHVQRIPMFWFNSAFLLYNAGTLFLFAFTTYLIKVLADDMLLYWGFHNILGVLQRILIVIGVSYDLKNHQSILEKKPLL